VFPEKSQGVYMLPATLAAAFVVLPICAVLQLSALARERFDGALWLYLFAELTLAVILCQSSTGAWVNYAIPSAVIGSILIARSLDRALTDSTSHFRLVPIVLAASVLPMGVATGAYWSFTQRHAEEMALARVFRELPRPRSEFYFVGRPGENRASGRLDL